MKTPSLLFSLPLLASVLAAQTLPPEESRPIDLTPYGKSSLMDVALWDFDLLGQSLLSGEPLSGDKATKSAAAVSGEKSSASPQSSTAANVITGPASLENAPCETRTLRVRGMLRQLDLLTDRVQIRPQHGREFVQELPGMTSLRETDRESTRRDALGIDRADLIAYAHGRTRSDATKLLITRRVCVKLAEGVTPSVFTRSAGALIAERPHYAEEALVLTYATALDALDAVDRLRQTPGVLGAHIIVASQHIPEFLPPAVQYFAGGGPEYQPYPLTDNVNNWVPPAGYLATIRGTSAYQWWANNLPTIAVPPPLVPIRVLPYPIGFLRVGAPVNGVPLRVDLGDFPPIRYDGVNTPKFQGEMADLRLPLAWEMLGDFDRPISGRQRKVLIIDDGIQKSHSDLFNAVDLNKLRHYNYFIAPPGDPFTSEPVDPPNDTHGTSLAGIVGARIKASGSRIAGVAPGCIFHSAVCLKGFVDDFDWADAFAYSEPITIRDSDGDNDYLDELRQGILFFEVCLNASSASGSGVPLDLEPEDWLWKRAIRFGATRGRQLKGIPYVTSAGNGTNGHMDTNLMEQKNSIFQIPVGGISEMGRRIAYSNTGASLVCVAPTWGQELPPLLNWPGAPGGWPTNRPIRKNAPLGPDDLPSTWRRITQGIPTIRTNNAIDFNFAGTSPSAAQVAGICALMLEVNPELQARDFKEILLRSTRTCSDVRLDFNGDILPDGQIVVQIGNQGHILKTGQMWRMSPLGRPFHHAFGTGIIDADKAVKIAKKWPLLPFNPLPPIQRDVTADDFGRTVANRNTETGGLYFPVMSNLLIPTDGRAIDVIIPGPPAGMRLEHIEIRVRFYHKRRGDLEIKLVAPGEVGWEEGRELESELFVPHRDDYNENRYSTTVPELRDAADWTFSTVRHWGTRVDSGGGGVWKVRIRDAISQGTTTVTSANDRIYVPVANPTDTQSQRIEGIGVTYHGAYTKGIGNSPPVVITGGLRFGPGTTPVTAQLGVDELGTNPSTGEIVFPVTSWDLWNSTVTRDDGIVVPVYVPVQPANAPVDYFEFFPPQARDPLDPTVLYPLEWLGGFDPLIPVPIQPEPPMWVSFQLDPALRPATWPDPPTSGPVGGLYQHPKWAELLNPFTFTQAELNQLDFGGITLNDLWLVVRNPDNANRLTNFILTRLNRRTGQLEFVPINPGRYKINVLAENLLGISRPKEIEITVSRPGYEEWRDIYWDVPEVSDDAISGWLADPDGDGLRNGLEYAMRLNPTVADPGPIPAYRIEGNEVVFSYTQDTTASQANLRPQVSEDLETWADVTPTLVGGTNSLADYEYRIPLVGDTRLFFRLWSDSLLSSDY